MLRSVSDERGEDPGLEENMSADLMARELIPRGNMQPGCSPLIGFIGPSGKDGHIRVYRDLTFRSFCEVPSNAVQDTVAIDPDDPDSPMSVLVPDATAIEIGDVTAHQAEAGFVAGNIVRGRLGDATADRPLAAATGCTQITRVASGCPTPLNLGAEGTAAEQPARCIIPWTRIPPTINLEP